MDIFPVSRPTLFTQVEWFVFGAIVLLGFILNVAGVTTFVERRVWARIQSRVGPNRVGPQGILQWLADGVKLVMKEDVIPREADSLLFRFAPYVVMMGFVATFVVLPFADRLVIAEMNIGLVYVIAVTSLIIVGILMAGWASNNKWSSDRRNPGRSADRELRNSRRTFDSSGHPRYRHGEHAGTHSPTRLGTIRLADLF